jgi:D-alanyl-lipoteichoic acid acyltransferase DltB (MBOAT superfamily)
MLKLYDARQEEVRGSGNMEWGRDWGGYVAFMMNPFFLVRNMSGGRWRGWRAEAHGTLRGAMEIVAGTAGTVALFRMDWTEWPFLAEHMAKVVVLYVGLFGVLRVLEGVWRAGGGRAQALMEEPFASRTPADFWRRYNRPMNQFLWKHVFKPTGRVRSAVWATMAVFAVSGVLHEYVFGVAVGRVQGYQMAFFLLQGAAVAATLRAKLRGWRVPAGCAGTLGFNLLSSVLFFGSVQGVVPFYSRGLPGWLVW